MARREVVVGEERREEKKAGRETEGSVVRG